MNEPVVFVENLFNTIAFPGNVLTADEEAAGFEAWNVSTARRSPFMSWRPTTANAQHYLEVTCDRIRAVNMLAIDRNSNLRGMNVTLQGSDDNFATGHVCWQGTIPTTITSPGDLDSLNGVLTEEGAFLVRFPTAVHWAWRFIIPAMGAGITQVVGGAWLGMGLQLDFLGRPHGEMLGEVMSDVVQMSATGWEGSTTPVNRRTGDLVIQLTDDASYELCRLHIEGHFLARKRAMWIIPNRHQAERALLAIKQPGVQGFRIESGWGYKQAVIGFKEHEPRTNIASFT